MRVTIRKPSSEYDFVHPHASHYKDSVVIIRTNAKIGRNDPCPCNSGKKYKRCHLPLQEGR